MTRRLTSLAVLALCLLALAGCRGRALPAGMEEQALLEAGREVLELVTAGDFQAVRAALRPDVAETVTEEELRALAARQLEGAGDFRPGPVPAGLRSGSGPHRAGDSKAVARARRVPPKTGRCAGKGSF